MKKLIIQLIVKIKGKTEKALKNVLAISLLMLASASALATPINVGVVTWDPDFDDGFGMVDFGASAVFSQWVTTNNSGAGDLNTITATDLSTTKTAASATTGDFLTGLGEINFLNGRDTSTPPTGFVCSECELTFAFGGLKIVDSSLGTFDITDAWFRVFSDFSADFVSGVGNYADVQDGDIWLEGGFDTFLINTGSLLSGSSEGLLSVTGGLAFGNFDTNNQIAGADLKLTGTANFSTNPTFANAGTVTFVGDTIPEPSTLAIFALALLLLAGVTHAKQR